MVLYYLNIFENEIFKILPEINILHICEYLNDGPFIVYYNKNEKRLSVCINKQFIIITKALIYKKLNPPIYKEAFLDFGRIKMIILILKRHTRKKMYEKFWYDMSVNKLYLYQNNYGKIEKF
jgi:hypothetical protein